MSLGKVAVIGQGYVGLPLAISAARVGWDVTGIDLSLEVVGGLNKGISHIEDVSDIELASMLESGNYRAASTFDAVNESSICIICVPTPITESSLPDLKYLESAIREVAKRLPVGSLLISESTSFPGTVTELIIPILQELRSDKGVSIDVVSAPERIDPRNEKFTLRNTPRIVGGITASGTKRGKDFYLTFCDFVYEVSSASVAEFAKLLENTFRQVNIALINQLVPFANSIGVDIREVVAASSTKPYGYMPFYPGAGVGGHCIPVDPIYLLWRAHKEGLNLPFISQADLVNSEMPKYVVKRLVEKIKPKSAGNVLILGVAYKSGLGDIRETPAKAVAEQLERIGFTPLWLDPMVKEFYGYKSYLSQDLVGAIVVTSQPDSPVVDLAITGVPILDCTGAFKAVKGVEQL